jgi:hypothetical protein
MALAGKRMKMEIKRLREEVSVEFVPDTHTYSKPRLQSRDS